MWLRRFHTEFTDEGAHERVAWIPGTAIRHPYDVAVLWATGSTPATGLRLLAG